MADCQIIIFVEPRENSLASVWFTPEACSNHVRRLRRYLPAIWQNVEKMIYVLLHVKLDYLHRLCEI